MYVPAMLDLLLSQRDKPTSPNKMATMRNLVLLWLLIFSSALISTSTAANLKGKIDVQVVLVQYNLAYLVRTKLTSNLNGRLTLDLDKSN